MPRRDRAACGGAGVAPAGLGRWLRARGAERGGGARVVGVGEIDGLVVTLVPARHWSRRGVLGTNSSLWGATSSSSGRSASTTPATLPGSTASPRSAAASPVCWPRCCRSAATAGLVHGAAGTSTRAGGNGLSRARAGQLVPMHWGTFQLTDEPLQSRPRGSASGGGGMDPTTIADCVFWRWVRHWCWSERARS